MLLFIFLLNNAYPFKFGLTVEYNISPFLIILLALDGKLVFSVLVSNCEKQFSMFDYVCSRC